MYYPKECFNIDMTVTKLAQKAYEDKQNRMYKWIEDNYPNYHNLNLREKYTIRQEYKKS
jgi:hypothetical protein